MELFFQHVGYLLFSLLFFHAAYNHIRHHTQLSGYAATGFGDCPVTPQLSYLCGWPVGIYLLAVGILTALGLAIGFFGAVVFLIPVTLLYHRNLQDPGTFKNIALLGAALALGLTI